MISYIDLINFGAAVGGAIIALLGLFLSISVQYFKKADKRFFVAFFSILVAYVAADLTSQISLVFADWGTWQLCLLFFLSSCSNKNSEVIDSPSIPNATQHPSVTETPVPQSVQHTIDIGSIPPYCGDAYLLRLCW